MSGAQAPSPAPAVTTYKLKPLTLPDGRRLPIVLQAANGPCPLLAIANVLLLRGQITLPVNAPDVSEVIMHACPEQTMCVVLVSSFSQWCTWTHLQSVERPSDPPPCRQLQAGSVASRCF